MNFEQLFLNSLISKNGLTPIASASNYHPQFIDTSKTTLEHFSYLQAYANITCTYPYHYEMKALDSYLLLYTIEGQGLLQYNHTSYTLLPNTVAFIDCRFNHSIAIANAATWRFNYIFINGNTLQTYYKLFSHDYEAICYPSDFSPIPNLFHELNEQPKEHHFKQELLNTNLITNLLTEVILAKYHPITQNNSIPFYIVEIKRDFENHYANFFSLDELASKYNISKYQLSREFSKHFNISPIHFLIQCRINASKKLLWTTDKTVTEIGSLVGIDNTNHFINLFRKNIGVTPLSYRKQRP